MKGWRSFKQTRWLRGSSGWMKTARCMPVPLHVAPRSCETASLRINALNFSTILIICSYAITKHRFICKGSTDT